MEALANSKLVDELREIRRENSEKQVLLLERSEQIQDLNQEINSLEQMLVELKKAKDKEIKEKNKQISELQAKVKQERTAKDNALKAVGPYKKEAIAAGKNIADFRLTVRGQYKIIDELSEYLAAASEMIREIADGSKPETKEDKQNIKIMREMCKEVNSYRIATDTVIGDIVKKQRERLKEKGKA